MKSFLSLFMATILFACGGGKSNIDQLTDSIASVDEALPEISQENIESILASIPAPLELSTHIKDAGIAYDKTLLNPTDNESNYTNSNTKALNLGIYGTDLGYTNIYGHTQDGLNYLSAVQKLSDDLGIGQFLDFQSIKRLTNNSNNLDSLLMITNQNFENINQHFIKQNQASLSTLLLTGGWLEALHIANQVTLKQMQNEELRERLGEQKIVLDNIIILLQLYSNQDSNIANLLKDMHLLENAFAAVDINYTYEESTSKVVDGVLEIVNKSTSHVTITDEDIQQIANTVEQIRNRIIS